MSAQQTAGVIVAGASFIQPTLVKIIMKQLGMGGTQMCSGDQGPWQACNLRDGTEPLRLRCVVCLAWWVTGLAWVHWYALQVCMQTLEGRELGEM